jgi:hypothetical protein
VLLLVALGLAIYPIFKTWQAHGATKNKAQGDADE